MDQNTIIEALQKALAQGSGDLGDLENLLKRAQQDVAKAKEEAKVKAEEEKKARGKEIADLANRLLEGKTTDEDAALVLNTWLAAKGHKGKPFTAKDLVEIFDESEKATSVVNDLNKVLEDLANDIKDWSNTYTNKKVDKKPAAQPEDVIDQFLKNFGLR